MVCCEMSSREIRESTTSNPAPRVYVPAAPAASSQEGTLPGTSTRYNCTFCSTQIGKKIHTLHHVHYLVLQYLYFIFHFIQYPVFSDFFRCFSCESLLINPPLCLAVFTTTQTSSTCNKLEFEYEQAYLYRNNTRNVEHVVQQCYCHCLMLVSIKHHSSLNCVYAFALDLCHT